MVWALHRVTYLDLMVNAPCAGGEGGLGIIAFLRRLPLFSERGSERGSAAECTEQGSRPGGGSLPAGEVQAGGSGAPRSPTSCNITSSKLYRISCALQPSHFADGHTVMIVRPSSNVVLLVRSGAVLLQQSDGGNPVAPGELTLTSILTLALTLIFAPTLSRARARTRCVFARYWVR